MRHDTYMKKMAEAEQIAKEAYGNVDMVNNPPHYNQTGIECIHAISAATDKGFKYYLQGNMLKYLWRFDYKDKPLSAGVYYFIVKLNQDKVHTGSLTILR